MDLTYKVSLFGVKVAKVQNDIEYKCDQKCHNSTDPMVFTIYNFGVNLIL